MTSLHRTLEDLNRKLELLKQGTETVKIAAKTEEDIQKIMKTQLLDEVMREGVQKEKEIQSLHPQMNVLSTLPIAQRIENQIVQNHEMKHIDDLIPETIVQEKNMIELTPKTIVQKTNKIDLVPETNVQEKNIEEIVPETIVQEKNIAELIPEIIIEEKNNEELIPETIVQKKNMIEIIPETIVEEKNINELIPATVVEDNKLTEELILESESKEDTDENDSSFEPRPEATTKLTIFNSSDLVLKDFRVEEEERGSDVVEEEDDGVGVKVISKGSLNEFIPTAIPRGAEDSLKSRRRNLFKGHSKLKLHLPASKLNKSQENTRSKLEPSNKLKLRKLFRNSDRNEITIVEKPNPRKIIFRKGLVRGQRRKVGSGKKNDPLVKSLQKQIRTQSNRLFSRRKPFTKIQSTPPPTATTTATATTTTIDTALEVRKG